MERAFRLFPENASTVAGGVDSLYLFMVAVSAFFSVLIFCLVFYFAIRYRRRSEDERPPAVEGSLSLELAWSALPFVIVMIMFGWGASLYFTNARPPTDVLEVYVVGKQWMWKLQHPSGRREINELHVPVGRAVKLTMTSEDVIHSFYVPAFRIKNDVLPGRYSTVWFEATKTGDYHLFCAEYCGNKHSGMIGRVVVMEPKDYQRWLSGLEAGETLASAGLKLFQRLGCTNCHLNDASGRGPALENVFGRLVIVQGGQKVMADETYIRESIVRPQARIVAGYPPIMPTFQGQLTEEGLVQIVAYLKSIGVRPERGGIE